MIFYYKQYFESKRGGNIFKSKNVLYYRRIKAVRLGVVIKIIGRSLNCFIRNFSWSKRASFSKMAVIPWSPTCYYITNQHSTVRLRAWHLYETTTPFTSNTRFIFHGRFICGLFSFKTSLKLASSFLSFYYSCFLKFLMFSMAWSGQVEGILVWVCLTFFSSSPKFISL